MVRAGSGGHGYLREWIWWMGFFSMGIGEAANFAAYAFAPASLVTPLGALSIVVTALLSSRYLQEKLNILGKIGCILCILGSTMLVLHAPKEVEISSMDELLTMLQNRGFALYVFSVITFCLSISFYFGPKYGNTNVSVYILMCSSVGSLSVMSCKGLGFALKMTINGTSNEMENWLTWALLFCVIFCVMVQMNYLNKALDLFNTGVVTPVYYVFFTTFVIVASAILFQEWKNMTILNVLGSLCGFFTIMVAIFLLNAFKEIEISSNNIRQIARPKREDCYRRRHLENHNNNRSNRVEETLVIDPSNTDSMSYGSPDNARNNI
ncbi:magnesium transporter NIPA2 isoform X2 [Venturia canescens]|nr:magnesium transporter NIPA2 isoform X2 [Venturia canescens]XP_043271287.1 magnesium transporter NIPA2 isoform X2 [Venturia canescens]XP_043271288.1 magnesium transporter NIPA2 isoform X2 [Venturia canescens]XP_043271289.1 magnesium transporter NIPA2 isoform X2 [Venturia canescens]